MMESMLMEKIISEKHFKEKYIDCGGRYMGIFPIRVGKSAAFPYNTVVELTSFSLLGALPHKPLIPSRVFFSEMSNSLTVNKSLD